MNAEFGTCGSSQNHKDGVLRDPSVSAIVSRDSGIDASDGPFEMKDLDAKSRHQPCQNCRNGNSNFDSQLTFWRNC